MSKNKTLDGAVKSGFKMGLAPIIDGNVTIVIVAAILMGAFGPTDGFWARLFNPIFFWFGPSTAGTIYSFGFTLLTSVLLNFVFGRVGDPRYDPRRDPLQGAAQPLVVRGQEGRRR